MKCAAIMIGSIVLSGAEPRPPRPWNLISRRSEFDVIGPMLDPTVEADRTQRGRVCAYRPWKRPVVIEFNKEQPAVEFEKYLKTALARSSRAGTSVKEWLAERE